MLQTERLRLAPFADGDLDALHGLWTNPDVRRYLWDDEIISREVAADAIARSHESFRRLGLGQFCLHEHGSRALVGFAGFRLHDDAPVPELLYGILAAYWGKGYATEACRALLVHGFEQCGFPKVLAATDTPNQPSVKVLQRLGMVFVDRRTFHGLDTVFYELGAEEFAAARAGWR